MRRLTGIAVSPGIAWGRAVILMRRALDLRFHVQPDRVGHELSRLDRARDRTRKQLLAIRNRVSGLRGGDLAPLFDAQLLMLDDPMLLPRASEFVQTNAANAEWAVQEAFDELKHAFDAADDRYLRERQGDVADLVDRLCANLREDGLSTRERLSEIDEPTILIADELTPSFAAQVDWNRVRGFATDAGSRTFHTAILARALEVPALVGLHDASRQVQPGQMVVLDTAAQELIIEPDEGLLAALSQSAHRERTAATVGLSRGKPAATADGTAIRLYANIGFAAELASAKAAGAEGIGLCRSEFLLSDNGALSDEDEQYRVYREIVEAMAPSPVTIRTFDVDESGIAPGYEAGIHGFRGLRLSLQHRDMFHTQLRALLRAARHGAVRIMLPFVTEVREVREARRAIADARADLARRGLDVPSVPCGVMIEVPAAAYIADLLAPDVDFFAIGTNDLIQYCLAIDRRDDRTAGFYAPLHPAILRLLVMVRRASRRAQIPVSVCGEMASDPAILPVLVGLGLREFSMAPNAIPLARQTVAALTVDHARTLARTVLRLSTVDEIEQALEARLGRLSEARE